MAGNLKYPEIKFLKDCEIFSSLSEDILKVVYARGQIVKIEQNKTIFDYNQPCEYLYVVRSGIVEICREDEPGKFRAVAYVGASASMGELAILTGSPYNSIARMPGGGEIFAISRNVFLSFLDMLPEFGRALSTLFAQRLESAARNNRIDRREQFRGSLKFFDLTTIIQTIVSSRLTGTLVITNQSEESMAEVNFERGAVRGAFLGNLLGEDAFYQLFQPPLQEGTFDFKSGPIQHIGDSRYDIKHAPSALLIEAARQHDELMEMMRKISPTDIFVPAKGQLLWLGEEHLLGLANKIFTMVKAQHLTVSDLVVELQRCAYVIYSVIKIMFVTKQIERLRVEQISETVASATPEPAKKQAEPLEEQKTEVFK